MTLTRFLTAGALLLASLPFGSAHAAATIGNPAPEFSAAGADGKTHALSDYRGHYVVLEWTNADCPFVRKHYDGGNMQSLQKDATGRGVIWLSVISSAAGKQGHVDAAAATALSQQRKAVPTAVLLDAAGTVGHQYEARTTPHLFIVDPQGKLIYKGGIDDKPGTDPGEIASSKNYVKAALDEALAGKAVSQAVTRPYGCSIKY